MHNIRPDRDSNPVPLSFKPQPDRMSHRGQLTRKRVNSNYIALIYLFKIVHFR